MLNGLSVGACVLMFQGHAAITRVRRCGKRKVIDDEEERILDGPPSVPALVPASRSCLTRLSSCHMLRTRSSVRTTTPIRRTVPTNRRGGTVTGRPMQPSGPVPIPPILVYRSHGDHQTTLLAHADTLSGEALPPVGPTPHHHQIRQTIWTATCPWAKAGAFRLQRDATHRFQVQVPSAPPATRPRSPSPPAHLSPPHPSRSRPRPQPNLTST
jgi:hypothetical protein